jgi:hypothetical protein
MEAGQLAVVATQRLEPTVPRGGPTSRSRACPPACLGHSVGGPGGYGRLLPGCQPTAPWSARSAAAVRALRHEAWSQMLFTSAYMTRWALEASLPCGCLMSGKKEAQVGQPGSASGSTLLGMDGVRGHRHRGRGRRVPAHRPDHGHRGCLHGLWGAGRARPSDVGRAPDYRSCARPDSAHRIAWLA